MLISLFVCEDSEGGEGLKGAVYGARVLLAFARL
jgi:hypothetical protein